MQKLRVGVVSYLNAMPLWYALQRDTDIELVPETPARLSELMQAGRLDIALMPVVEVLREPGLTFLPDLGIGADGVVESVGLFTRVEPAQIRTLALTTASRTSVALARVILEALGAKPDYSTVQLDPARLDERPEDAVLMIGDACLQARRAVHDRVFIDLAAEWKLLTGLPVIFAVWAGRTETLTPQLHERMRAALAEGHELAFEMIRYAAADTGWSEAELGHYLGEVIQHRLTPRHLEGLLEFTRRAAAQDLVPASSVDRVLDELHRSRTEPPAP
jgi:predicted solute-binding protein